MINALLYDEILHYILEDSNMFVRSLGAVTESFFSYATFEPYYLTYETAVDFYNEHEKLPTKFELMALVKSKIDNDRLYSNQFKEINLKLFFDKIYESIYTPKHLEATFFKNYERGEILRILEKYTTELDAKSLAQLYQEVEAAHLVSLKMSGNQCQPNYAFDIAKTTHIYQSQYSMENLYSIIPTGFDVIDGYLNGGLHKKQLGVVLAPPNKGKTAIMLNMAYNAAAMGYKVLFLEGEMTKDELHDRLNCYASGLKNYELASKHSKEFLDYTIAIRRTGGALYIEEFDMEGMNASEFKERVKRYKDLHNIDIVFVDYFDIMEKEDNEELRLQLKKLYTAGKKLARELNIAVWTASQTNRGGVNNPLVTEYNIGEDFSKVATADKIMSLNSTIEEYNENKARLFIIKNRGGKKYKMVELKTDFEIMQLTETIEIDYSSFIADYDITERGTMVRKKTAKKQTAGACGTEQPAQSPTKECNDSDFKELYGNSNY